jgi:hypothetical protein
MEPGVPACGIGGNRMRPAKPAGMILRGNGLADRKAAQIAHCCRANIDPAEAARGNGGKPESHIKSL